MSDQCGERRDALCKMISLMGICTLGSASSLIVGCESTSTKSTNQGEIFDVGSAPSLATVGGAFKTTFGTNNGGQPVMIIRTATSEFVALTAICPHQGCELGVPKSAGATIDCPCHGSKFSSADGSVVTGPADSPLRKYAVAYNAKTNTLAITF